MIVLSRFAGERPVAPWRWIRDGGARGTWNMAVDEAILDRYAGPDPPGFPTLRLYAWVPPALSLGRGQIAADSHDPAYLHDRGIDLVRRPTGGMAVLHEDERTYSVVGVLRRDPFPGGVLDTYHRVAGALVAGLRKLGVPARIAGRSSRGGGPDRGSPVCFQEVSSYEIVVDERKIAGAAQLRRKGAFLQHGSLLLRADADRSARAIGREARPERFTSVEEILRRMPDPQQVDSALAEGFAEALGADLAPGTLTAGERARARELESGKYAADAWTLRGVPPVR